MAKTPEEVKNDYILLMGDDLGRLFHELTIEEDWLRDKWAIFQELEHSQERVDLLFRTAPNFFGSLSKLLYEDAMLHLSRLTDPPESNYKKTNLTVQLLPASISDPKLKDSVNMAINNLKNSCEFARDMRNRHLAHADLKTARNENPLPEVMPKDIAQALKYLRAVLLLIEERYNIPPTLYTRDWWGAEALVQHLQLADRAENERAQT